MHWQISSKETRKTQKSNAPRQKNLIFSIVLYLGLKLQYFSNICIDLFGKCGIIKLVKNKRSTIYPTHITHEKRKEVKICSGFR